MSEFEYINRYDHLNPEEWKPGDPWERHYNAGPGQEDRDRQIEQFISRDYVVRTFTATLKQNNVAIAVAAAPVPILNFTRGARVNVEYGVQVNAAGAAGTEIKVTPVGLPTAATTQLFGQFYGMGQFWYYDNGTALRNGTSLWDGTDVHFIVGGSPTNYLGLDPNFAVAAGDALFFTLGYRPVPI